MPRTIDLGAYRTAGTLVFAGRIRGGQVRSKAGLDETDKDPEPIVIHVPEDVWAVTSSFFLGMFGPSVRTLGEAGFAAHYLFTGKDISPIVKDGVREALRTGSPL
jgi:hypothetical protein